MFQMINAIEKIELETKEFLGNFDSGALILMDESNQKLLTDFEKGRKFNEADFNKDPDLLDQLIYGGFFEKIENPLSSAYLHVTNRCNLNCIGCYSYDRTRNCSDILNLEDIKNILQQLADNGVDKVTISGGEPLIRKDILEILEYAKESAEIETLNLITNGTVYNEEQLIGIKKYVSSMAVSIDGYSYENPRFLRGEGSFPKVMDFIKKAKKLGLPIAILPTLHSKNIDSISNYMELSQQVEVPISFSLMTCSEELEDYIPITENLDYLVNFLFEFMKKGKVPLMDYSELEARKSCGAGSSIISVASDGQIYPCHMMHDTDTIMGNILHTPLKEILKNAEEITPVDQVDTCKDCGMKNICGGGCKARALLINGGWDKPDPYCSLNKSFYSKFLKEQFYGE